MRMFPGSKFHIRETITLANFMDYPRVNLGTGTFYTVPFVNIWASVTKMALVTFKKTR